MKDLKDNPRLSRSREADDDASDEGEAPASRETNHNFASLFGLCRKGADDVAQSEEQTARSEEQTASKRVETLADVYRLKEYTDSKSGARKKLQKAYEEAGIRVSKSTTNEFTPLVKLIFSKNTPPATLSRYAAALWLAEKKKIGPDGFVGFVQENGGVTECARLATERRGKASGRLDRAEMLEQKLKERRKNATVVKMARRRVDLTGGGLYVLLADCTRDGKYRCLGHRPVSDSEALSILKD